MSDQRRDEALAAAAADWMSRHHIQWEDDRAETLDEIGWDMVQTILAAIDTAAPTDAEVEWALEAWNEYRVWNMDDDRDAMRAALIAARTARP
jgi:hypothetical protein